MDKTDINRMFPGYANGETTQRIAAAVFEALNGFEYGIQLASYYVPGDFIPHVRMLKTGYEDVETARLFGMRYVTASRWRTSSIPTTARYLAHIIHPYNGQILSDVKATKEGTVFFAHNRPVVLQNALLFMVHTIEL